MRRRTGTRNRPRRARTAARVGALVAVAGVVAGCGGQTAAGSDGPVAQAGAAAMVAGGNTLDQAVPDGAASARLVDQDGRPFTLASLRGTTVVLAPVLTLCQETCPMTSANLHRAAAKAGGSGDVVFLEVSVDPARDTVHRLHAYQQKYGALPGWRLATGTPGAVTAFWKALGVSLEKVPTEEKVRDWLTGKTLAHPYDVQHQDLVMIVGPSGRMRWIDVGRPDARGERLPSTLQAFLSDQGRQNYSHPGAGGASAWRVADVEQALAYLDQHPGRG